MCALILILEMRTQLIDFKGRQDFSEDIKVEVSNTNGKYTVYMLLKALNLSHVDLITVKTCLIVSIKSLYAITGYASV